MRRFFEYLKSVLLKTDIEHFVGQEKMTSDSLV